VEKIGMRRRVGEKGRDQSSRTDFEKMSRRVRGKEKT